MHIIRYNLCHKIWKVRSYKDVLRLIALLGKIQVMLNEVGFIRSEFDLHVKLTPSFF